MQLISYNNELISAQSQFMRVFSNIQLNRKDKDGNNIIVNCLNGRRSRLIKDLQNPTRGQITLPSIYVSRMGIERQPSRNANMHSEVLMSRGKNVDYNLMTPTPVDIMFELLIVTKYMEDMDSILSNFIPFFNQDIYVKTRHPKYVDTFMNNQIIWDGNVSEEVFEELENITQDIQVSTLSFRYKTYIFAGTSSDINLPSSNIIEFTMLEDGDAHNLVGGFFPVQSDKTFDGYFAELTTSRPISSVICDQFSISGGVYIP